MTRPLLDVSSLANICPRIGRGMTLRRHRHRRRAQRPDHRRLSRARGREGARPRAAPRARRRRGHRGGLPRLPLLGLLVRRLAAAAGDHPRPRPAAARPRDPAARRHVHADAERRLPVARERSRARRVARSRATRSSTPRPTTNTARRWSRWARFVEADPRHDAAGSDVARPARAAWSCSSCGSASVASPTRTSYNQVQLMTMSAVDFLDQWFETDVLKATMSASGIIGTFLGVRSPGTAYVLLHHYMGEIDGAFRSWGFARGGTGAISNAIASAAREAGVEIRTEARGRSRSSSRAAGAHGVVLQERRRDRRATSCSSSVDPRLTFLQIHRATKHLPGRVRRRRAALQVPRLVGKVNLALDALPDFTCRARPGAAPARRDLDLAERRLHGARLRRREVRTASRGGPTSTW